MMDNKLEERLMACCPDWATLMLPARGPDDEPAEVQMRNLITEAADEITRLNAENERLRETLAMAVPIIADERRVMVESHINRSGPDKGEVTDPEALPYIEQMDAFLARASALITKASRDSGHG